MINDPSVAFIPPRLLDVSVNPSPSPRSDLDSRTLFFALALIALIAIATCVKYVTFYLSGQHATILPQTLSPSPNKNKGDVALKMLKDILKEMLRPMPPIRIIFTMMEQAGPQSQESGVQSGIAPAVPQMVAAQYYCWYNESENVINIQLESNFWAQTDMESQKNKIGIVLNEDGKVVTFIIDGQERQVVDGEMAIPQRQKLIIEKAIQHVAEVTCTIKLVYGMLSITTHEHASVAIVPYILSKLGSCIDDNNFNPNYISVNFVGTSGVGDDDGGLTKDFFTQMFNDLHKSDLISTKFMGSPEYGAIFYQKGNTTEEKEFYTNVGKALYLVMRNNILALGNVFSGNYLNMIYFIAKKADCTMSDIQKRLITMNQSDESALVFSKIVDLLYPEDQMDENTNDIIEEKYNQMSTDDQKQLKIYARASKYGEENDLDDLDEDEKLTIDELRNGLRSAVNTVCDRKFCFPMMLIGTSLRETIDRKKRSLDPDAPRAQLGDVTAAEFHSSIAGVHDKQAIANAIEIRESLYYNPPSTTLVKKVSWLKSWIRNDASDAEVAQFVRFVSGSYALPASEKIQINGIPDRTKLFPVAHTCYTRMDLPIHIGGKPDYLGYRDDTEEDFIKMIQFVIKKIAGYQMG